MVGRFVSDLRHDRGRDRAAIHDSVGGGVVGAGVNGVAGAGVNGVAVVELCKLDESVAKFPEIFWMELAGGERHDTFFRAEGVPVIPICPGLGLVLAWSWPGLGLVLAWWPGLGLVLALQYTYPINNYANQLCDSMGHICRPIASHKQYTYPYIVTYTVTMCCY